MSDKSNVIKERLAKVREIMKESGISVYVVPTGD